MVMHLPVPNEAFMNIGIRDLRDNFSKYLSEVREGATITVTDHGKPVAQISPIEQISRFDELVAQGVITPAVEPKGELPVPVAGVGSIRDLIAEQRG